MFFRYAVRNFIIYIDGNFFNLYRSNNVHFLFMFCLYQFHRICLFHCSILKINFQILPGTCLSIITPTSQYSSTKWSPTWNTMKVMVRVRKSHFQTYSYTSAYHSTYPLCLYHMMVFFSKTHSPCSPAYQSLYPPWHLTQCGIWPRIWDNESQNQFVTQHTKTPCGLATSDTHEADRDPPYSPHPRTVGYLTSHLFGALSILSAPSSCYSNTTLRTLLGLYKLFKMSKNNSSKPTVGVVVGKRMPPIRSYIWMFSHKGGALSEKDSEVWLYWMNCVIDFEVSKAQVRPSRSLFLLPVDPHGECSATSPAPYFPA